MASEDRFLASIGSRLETKEMVLRHGGLAAGVYTASVYIPAGSILLDILVNGVALWNNGTSATLKVGDTTDDDGYFTGVNAKATDLLAGESLSFGLAGGKAGAYIANSQVSPRYYANGTTISAIMTTVGTVPTTGETRISPIWIQPSANSRVDATYVAS